MTNAIVTVNGGTANLPTILGQGAPRLRTAGKIRAGIKVLTKNAANNPKAREIYERGVQANPPFEDTSGNHRGSLTSRCPCTDAILPCGPTTFRILPSRRTFSTRTARIEATGSNGCIASRSYSMPIVGKP